MTKEAALHSFFNSFNIPGYPSSAVPEDAVFPWLTYDLTTSAWDGGEVGLTVNLWYHTTDEAIPNAKARELYKSPVMVGLSGSSVGHLGVRVLHTRKIQLLREDT